MFDSVYRVQVYTGHSILDLEDPPKITNLTEPLGWQVIDLRRENQKFVRAFVVQVQILQNHQNGRDTHVRACKVLGPLLDEVHSPRVLTLRVKDLEKVNNDGLILLDRCIR